MKNTKSYLANLLFADWEELPSTAQFAKAWDNIVQDMINFTGFKSTFVPKHAPCLDMSMKVRTFQGGLVALMNIKRGDWIFDGVKWTKVIGICSREVNGGIGDKGSRISDGVWVLNSDNIWRHPSKQCDKWKWQGIQLITESGKFRVYTADLKTSYIVRDFTEVGYDQLAESYVREDRLILEKKLEATK